MKAKVYRAAIQQGDSVAPHPGGADAAQAERVSWGAVSRNGLATTAVPRTWGVPPSLAICSSIAWLLCEGGELSASSLRQPQQDPTL